MRAYFGRRYTFSASHRLHADSLTPEQNRAAYGKCNNPHGHGHNYVIEVLVGGNVDPGTGMVVNLVDVDTVVQSNVITRFDHTHLNLDPLFTSLVPTTENLCRVIYRLISEELRGVQLESVRVEETENNFFECHDAGPEFAGRKHRGV